MSKREFELDLTSVCVGSGVVQLPLKMQSLFTAGELPAIVDGEALLLAFSEPRRLSGFKEHFERRGLRSNDKVRFEVDIADDRVVALVAASIKRERTKPTQQRTSPEHGAADEAHTGSVAQQPASGQASSSWGDLDGGGQVRAVRKVRVEGGLPQPISPATQQFTASARGDVHRHRDARSASKGTAGFGGWTPLDGLSPEGDQQLPSLHDYPDATVREVRRSRATVNAAEEARTVDLEVAWASAAAEQSLPPLYSHGFEVTDQYAYTAQRSAEPATASISQVPTSRRTNETMRPGPEAVEQLAAVPSRQMAEAQVSRAVSPPKGETTAAQPHLYGAVAAPRIPVPRNTAAGSTWQPTPASGLNSPEPSEVVRQPRLIEEADITPARVRADGATPATRPVQYGQDVQHSQPVQYGQDVQHSQPMRDGAAQQPSLDHTSPTPRAQAPARNPVARAIDDAEFGGEYLPSGRSLEAALLESSNGQ
ncbi:MAG TPA: hypothetical protein VFN03_12790, partial [Trueperaceae bacterium]|nr:hypothetical protein [Trueperaceae bacterium]